MGIKQKLSQHFDLVVPVLKQLRKKVPGKFLTASSVAFCVLLLRALGLLQSFEWAGLDLFFRLRPLEYPEERITIVTIDEASLREVGTWPIPDAKIAELLQIINAYNPRAIGLDIYRDLEVEPGHQLLVDAYRSIPNIIGIELLLKNKNLSVKPPKGLNPEQVGLNNLLIDGDGKIRRNLLYLHSNQQRRESFAFKLAQLYLRKEGITFQKSKSHPKYWQLGKAVFPRFESDAGGYVQADAGGYQYIVNFPKIGCKKTTAQICSFQEVSMRDVLAQRRAIKNLINGRVVLIGSTAQSLQDFVLIPYSEQLIGSAKSIAGVELQAYFISEILRAALGGRPMLQFWPDILESLWICAWAYAGATVMQRIRRPIFGVLILILACICLTSLSFLVFIYGWWIPVIPTLITLSASGVVITIQIAQIREELKRSKEFLHQVINTIADPIFVKNEKCQFIALNEAYCRFSGYSMEELLESKSDDKFFPKYQADVFRQQDELVLQHQQAKENEEEFTDANGRIYFIATKRSFHKDAAGNSFLVGVIRDITQRKLLEQQLKRITDELRLSNKELKQKEDNLRYLAYHDPLTGLPNRKSFAESLHESLQWAKTQKLLVGLLFIDLDGFKQVNDTLGHEMGDLLLVTVSQRLSNCLRGSDTVSRLGGDEFTVILRSIPDKAVAIKVANKILASLQEPIILDGNTARVSASIGISIYPINSQDAETLIKQADSAMYRAKHKGKSCFEFA